MDRRNFIKCLSGSAICSIIPSQKIDANKKIDIYLTIDDGPRKSMENILNVLENNPATFFMIGKNIEKNEKLVYEALERGHLIGNHSYNHPSFSNLSVNLAKEEIEKTHNLIDDIYRQVSIKNPKLFRFPYGDRGSDENEKEISKFLKNLDYRTCFWNVDLEDWKYYNKKKTLGEIIDSTKNIKKDDVVLCHDLSITGKYTIPYLLSKEKYNFKLL
jgi:peptidoglycan/xylan/chitin deacetylase (PgdA/CDA1 family)